MCIYMWNICLYIHSVWSVIYGIDDVTYIHKEKNLFFGKFQYYPDKNHKKIAFELPIHTITFSIL